ncbi:MAG TPA: hypothetical protein VIP10_03560 [Burkholderiaceae bacterium]
MQLAAQTLGRNSVDWIRIYATRLQQSRPELSAEDVVQVAIRQFQACSHLAPEQAAEQQPLAS